MDYVPSTDLFLCEFFIPTMSYKGTTTISKVFTRVSFYFPNPTLLRSSEPPMVAPIPEMPEWEATQREILWKGRSKQQVAQIGRDGRDVNILIA